MLRLFQAASRASLRLSGSRVIHSLAEGAERPAEISEPRDSAGLLDPVLRKCELRIPVHRRPVQAWVESLRGFEQERIGLAELHPDVFATAPRLDIVHQVAIWQRNFRRISYANTKTRAELLNITHSNTLCQPSSKFLRSQTSGDTNTSYATVPAGGVAHGPRGPTSYYYMLPMKVRALGLKVALTVKLMQDDLHIVDSLELPTADPQYLTELAQYRHWGSSVLLVDLTHEEMPKNVVAATSGLNSFNLIPAVGLNVYSMLKHQTLVLTLPSVAFLEDKLLWQDSRYTPLYPFRLPYSDFP
ncbi:large ribosomal subunit protein uL4m isoform 1 [Mus musculus]|nr:large ribosomal subunit protein uL4m isoform 1 [Mus musculus]EDL25147.1 mitochondrial ribosomal protein L4, isoform CRA_a [Mus musculus]|eukprot:XP_006510602.1 PREDICTED: 39S ribosomal protein L4, mitochondrial isoform X1 [Mus musculus]